ncbi:MAG TPA: type II toxin-antitoxin system prevent-host-death family antitoxin [Terracidiphilus sp.]|jgi:prevent-host-death family protein|nr:type II toxin-antitoxin system prevent-host-death family antitoxin [Terracidiphilus sp.]
MRTATIFEAKTNLSELVRRAQQGEEVLITSGRERKPVARLVAIDPLPASRRIGFLEGQGDVGPEFFEPLPEEELRLWNGESE